MRLGLIALALTLAACSPRFAVGQCVQARGEELERWETPPHIVRIVDVGRRAYRVSAWTADRQWLESVSFDRLRLDHPDYFRVVPCPDGSKP